MATQPFSLGQLLTARRQVRRIWWLSLLVTLLVLLLPTLVSGSIA